MDSLFKRIKPPVLSGFAPHQEDEPILDVVGLSVLFDGVTALEDISFILKGGERVAIVGPNGAGKSTLLQVISGVLHPSAGEVNIFGHAPGGHICISYVPQRSNVDWTFPVTVADVVMMGRISKLGPMRWPRAIDWEKVREALETVDLLHLEKRQISELSGGQQQRMFIARALAQEAELVLMDEPLTGLDLPSRDKIFKIFDTLQGQNVTVLVSMHDLQLAAEKFDKIILLRKSMLGFGTPAEVFTQEQLIKAYGSHLHLIETEDEIFAVSDTCCEGEHHDHGLD